MVPDWHAPYHPILDLFFNQKLDLRFLHLVAVFSYLILTNLLVVQQKRLGTEETVVTMKALVPHARGDDFKQSGRGSHCVYTTKENANIGLFFDS